MKAELVNKENVKDFAEVLASTPVQVEMSALDFLLITTTVGHSSISDRRAGIERTISNISKGLMEGHPLAMLTPAQRSSVLNRYSSYKWEDMKECAKDILKQLGMGE